jgi:hypothetical protein
VTHPISPRYRPSNSLNKCSSIHHSPSPGNSVTLLVTA